MLFLHNLAHCYSDLLQLRKAMDGATGTKGSSGSASNTPALVLDSLPFGGDEGETQPLHSKEMDLLAKEFKNMSTEPDKGPDNEAPLVTCIYHGGILYFLPVHL